MVDDSGLFIGFLDDFPGVYSAHVLPTIGNKGILKLMDGIIDRNAYFECCVSFYDGKELEVLHRKGAWKHNKSEQGDHGFGFDPIFSPEGYKGKSFGEIELKKKNTISHRGRAFDSFFKWYSNEKEKR